MAQARDQIGHFDSRQLPAFARFRTLRHLDFQLVTMVQILRRHAKATRRNLLNFRRRIIAIWLWHEMRRVFTTLATIGFCTDAVHRNIQRFMRLWRQRPEAHARRHKPFADRRDAFNLVHRNRFRSRCEIQQITQMDRWIGLHFFGILLPQIKRCAITGRLQQMHGLRFPSVFFARSTFFVKPTNRQNILLAQPTFGMNFGDFALNPDQTNARNTAVHPGEKLCNHCP